MENTKTVSPHSARKWVKWTVLSIVALVVIAGIIVYCSLNSIIRGVVQEQATASMNVPTTLNSVALSIFGGSLSLKELEVGSPPNFSSPHTLTLGGCGISVHYGELRQTPIHISHITLDNPVLYVEQSGLKLNIQALMDQMPQTPESSNGQPSEPLKLIIDRLDVNNAQVNFLPGLPGLSTQVPVTIPSLTLTNVGNAEGNQNGAAIKDVVMQVITAMAAKAGDVAKLPAQLKALLSTDLCGIAKQLGGDFNRQFQGAAGSLGNVVDQGGKTVNNIGNTINGLIGGNKQNGQ
jgi:uncharacterized protein involved in outer membrane biogenesis